MPDLQTILVIDDDRRLTTALELYLSNHGYRIVCAYDGREGLSALHEHAPDLVVLDVMMPEMDGWEACQRIREVSNVPIVMLTARGNESDRITGLRLGADDYVAKPFSMRELEARAEAVLRRSRLQQPKETTQLYADDTLVIDGDKWEVRLDGELVGLTPTELRVLFYLVSHSDRVVTHEELLEHVWGSEYVGETDYPKLFVWRIRQKIEKDPTRPRYITTVRGIGYCFNSAG
ncbi:MAG: response regulator transcription factor [Anaerolineae bacterium]